MMARKIECTNVCKKPSFCLILVIAINISCAGWPHPKAGAIIEWDTVDADYYHLPDRRSVIETSLASARHFQDGIREKAESCGLDEISRSNDRAYFLTVVIPARIRVAKGLGQRAGKCAILIMEKNGGEVRWRKSTINWGSVSAWNGGAPD